MVRARRHYIPGQIWHLTHRCHKKEFLLKFSKDRKRWIEWLFQAKTRYGVRILNYMVTSNHIHLLVVDTSKKDVIPRSMQLIAGRTAQEYNLRKKRNGAFWEDRYHATAIEDNQHLIQCLIYIDLNMVRAGVVKHPSEWMFSGYNEIQSPRKRYSIIDYTSLLSLLNFENYDDLKTAHQKWVDAKLKEKKSVREAQWTQSVAVGSKQFVGKVKEALGYLVRGRNIKELKEGSYQIRETQLPYNKAFEYTDTDKANENTYPWEIESVIS